MIENQRTPEMINLLDKTLLSKVGDIYLKTRFPKVLGAYPENQRNNDLQTVQEEYPKFRARIEELLETMRRVGEAKKTYPPKKIYQMQIQFNATDIPAQLFLGDILFSRVTTAANGNMDSNDNYAEEARNMASEMGLHEGWNSEEGRKITLIQCVEKTLDGSLKIAH